MRTVKDVQDALDNIKAMTGDPESAHADEDSLFINVLKAVAEGTGKNPQEMAKLALTSQDIDFPRWYA